MKTKEHRDNLIERFKQKDKLEYIFFWGHTETATITKTCFSQWFPASFEIDGIAYPTAEHFMMAEKARLFGDTKILEKILSNSSPKTVKALGRSVKKFDALVWEANCYSIVVKANTEKFTQNIEMAEFLLNTKDRVIVEASPFDKVWGIGMSQDDNRCCNPELWDGDNLLGFALMEVRNLLKGTLK